jgi:hypothetical protein
MMGAGGSLILEPMLYYGFGVTPFKHCIYNSFLVLFFLAGYGAWRGHSQRSVVWNDAGIFGICVSGLGCVLGGFIASRIPSQVQLLCFGVLVTVAASYMLIPKNYGGMFISPRKKDASLCRGPMHSNNSENYTILTGDHNTDSNLEVNTDSIFHDTILLDSNFSWSTIVIAIVIGFICGMTGVGGGFMLVPLLTYIGHKMDTAVPTSQAVICCTSLLGFLWYALFNGFSSEEVRFSLCLALLVISIAGLTASERISTLLTERTRKLSFAIVLICIGIFTIITDPNVLSFGIASSQPHTEFLDFHVVQHWYQNINWYYPKVIILGAAYGLVFGMMGAGGSLILKPLLYFGLGVTPFKQCIYNAFFILFFLAGYGAWRGHSQGNVAWKDAGILGICVSSIGCFFGSFVASQISSHVQLLSFGVLVTFAAAYMIIPTDYFGTLGMVLSPRISLIVSEDESKQSNPPTETHALTGDDLRRRNTIEIIFQGSNFSCFTVILAMCIGFLCGMTGVGGGFMLVPLLTHIGHNMKTAVPTSQAIICYTSFLGFFWYALFNGFRSKELNFSLCLAMLAISMAGLSCSERISTLLTERARKLSFAILLISIGLFTIISAQFK